MTKVNVGDTVSVVSIKHDTVLTGSATYANNELFTMSNGINYFHVDHLGRYTVHIIKRAPIPEPKGEGAIVSGESLLTGPHRFVRIDNGLAHCWLSIDGFFSSKIERSCDNWEFVSNLRNFTIEYEGKS